MNKILYLLPILMMALACTPKVPQKVAEVAPAPMELTSFKDSVSYILGASSARRLKEALGDSGFLDEKIYKLAVVEGFEGKSRMDEATENAMLSELQTKMQEQQKAKAAAEAEAKKKVNDEFFAENAQKEGVKTTASGLQYKVLVEGTGAMPSASDQVEVHYEGRLVDGTVFDSSHQRGSTATFGVGQVIKGWTEALQLMKEGAKYQLYIPSELAYGNRATGKIKPGDLLIFDVELIKVIK